MYLFIGPSAVIECTELIIGVSSILDASLLTKFPSKLQIRFVSMTCTARTAGVAFPPRRADPQGHLKGSQGSLKGSPWGPVPGG